MKSEFIKPKLVGERFNEHSIPVEVLKDWAAFEGLVAETAKWLYLQENSERQRVPRGFVDGFALHLSSVGVGSAIATLDRIHPPGSLLPDAYAVWFEKARDRVLDVMSAVHSGTSIDTLLPKNLLSYFDQFGRSLRGSERVEFTSGDKPVVIYDTKIRKALVLRTASEYRTEEQLRGAISELDAEKGTLTFKLVNGRKISGTYAKEVREQAVAALGSFGESLVLAECIVVRDQSDNAKSIEAISRIEPLDPLDVPARLEALALLKDGWMDGEGIALSKGSISWFSGSWMAFWPEDLPLPYLYPTPLGMLQAEWSGEHRSVTLEVDTSKKTASLLVSRNDDGEVDTDLELNLEQASGWSEIARIVRSLPLQEKSI